MIFNDLHYLYIWEPLQTFILNKIIDFRLMHRNICSCTTIHDLFIDLVNAAKLI